MHANIIATETVNVGDTPGYRCVVDDGTGQLDLLFLGRPKVSGLHVGVDCRVSGRIALRNGSPVLWNPRYQLDPDDLPASVPGNDSAVQHRRPPTGEQPRAGTGHLHVYLGMAAGVGKTYAMLAEAHRRVQDGCDVVVGFVTTHERPQTESMLGDLEVVPPKLVDYHGAQFEEMDLDAVLARHPDVALVDELAHSNIPGSGRHAKRWQDVLELLEADVDVMTTVNVQHIQSLADAAAQITATRVRERVPDAVLRHANRVELIEAHPEQLRRRMRHGNIYPPGRVQHALNGFFRTENLSALSELTRRFIAGETVISPPAAPRAQARQRSDGVLVGVTAAQGTEVVLRRAALIATGLKADLHVAHVASTWTRHLDLPGLAAVRKLAEGLGANWIEIAADDPVAALMNLARERQVTQIVVGPSRRNRWKEFLGGGSTVRRLTRLAGKAGIDVHIIVRPCDQRSAGHSASGGSIGTGHDEYGE